MNRKRAVFGFGKTGRALLDFLLSEPPDRSIYLFNDAPIADSAARRTYAERGVRFGVGPAAFAELAGMDEIILSPGVNGRQERFDPLRRSGIEILSEIEFAFRRITNDVVAVTGTNGKSTTVSLIHHMFSRSGRPSVLAGNIGQPFIAEVGRIPAGAVVVLELSSFQLEEIERFRPRVAALLNITPDHLDRYPDMDAYVAAKLKLFANQSDSDSMVLNEDDPLLTALPRPLGRGRALGFSRRRPVPGGCGLDGDRVVLDVAGRSAFSLRRNPLRGVHNLENILAAALACHALGVEAAAIEEALATFTGLAHRMERVGAVGGVEFVNDSKATNVDAALKSLLSFDGNLVIILGGKDKGSDYTALAEPLRERAVRILLIGKAAPTIAAQLPALADRFEFVADLAEAVEKGHQALAGSGGTVLLAPACASFDMFDNFEHRGDVFRGEVQRFMERNRHG
jgi:UDP-N-acetylmuramoylalanine--D-glutamate ligase